jgi:outer membrane protein assembly factor BamB
MDVSERTGDRTRQTGHHGVWLLFVMLVLTEPTARKSSAGDIKQVSAVSSSQENSGWPQFRGPDGQGHVGTARLPLTWSETENVVWKKPVMGLGQSSPVIEGNRIWLTSNTDGRKIVRAFSFDSESGRQMLMTDELFDVSKTGRVLAQYGYASPTALLDGDRVFVHFGASGTACLKRDGTVVWKRVLPYYQHHGPATSPVLADGTLVILCDGYTHSFYDKHEQEGVDDFQFVVGLNPETGEIRWKTPRESQHSYSTPLVMTVGGRTQVVCPGGNGVWAYNPSDGAELWYCKYDGYSVVPRPVAAQGLIFVCTGYDNASLFAIREGAAGDCTRTHVAWKTSRNIPHVSSPIVAGDYLFFVNDNGIASCLDIKTGKPAWTQRLEGHFAASPISVGDRLYFSNEEGTTYVLRAASKFEELARNPLEGKFLASPAVAGNRLYLRSEKYLYCIADNAGNTLSNRSPK